MNSTYGRGFIAVHDDEVAASASGINPVRYKVTAFVIGALLRIAGGLCTSTTSRFFTDRLRLHEVHRHRGHGDFGGMGRTAGVIIAAILLTLLPEFLRGFADYRMIIYSLMIIVLMIARPQGLFTFGKSSKAGGAQ